MHPNRIHALDLEPRPLQLIDKPPERRARVRAGEDVLVHEEAPDQVLVLPALAQSRNLQEEDAIVVEHVVHLPQERREVPHPDVLGHLQAGDLLVAARGHGDVAVVHAEDPALAFLDPGFPHRAVAEGGLVPAQGHACGVGAVLRAGVFGEGAPAAADVEEGFAGAESDLLADDGELVVLELFEGFFGVDVGDDAAGVDHAGAEEPAVEVVAAVVVVADLFFVCVVLVSTKHVRRREGCGGMGHKPWDRVCMITSGIIPVRKNRKRLIVNRKLAQSCRYSSTSSASPLNSTSPLKYISWKVSNGILFLPLYLILCFSSRNCR